MEVSPAGTFRPAGAFPAGAFRPSSNPPGLMKTSSQHFLSASQPIRSPRTVPTRILTALAFSLLMIFSASAAKSASTASGSTASGASGTRPKQIFAHYMGCFPAGYGPIEYHRRHSAEQMTPESKELLGAIGGRFVNYPLTPQNAEQELTPEASAELEIRRAMRAGIDGFAVDAWAGGETAHKTFSYLIEAAERMKVPFFVTICMDASCHKAPEELPGGKAGNYSARYAESIRWVLEHYGQSPNLARRDGKLLIFGYHSRGICRSTPETKEMPEGPERWSATFLKAYQETERLVGEPIFWHFCFSAFFHDVKPELFGGRAAEDVELEAARFVGKHFGAVGGFLGDPWSERPEIIQAIREGGAEWSQPIIPQYVNKAFKTISEPGLDLICDRWERAIQTNATLLQFVTWNDYGEDTILAPGYSTGYSLGCVNRFFSDLWKTGKKLPDQEQIHVIFRRHTNSAAESFPFRTRLKVRNGLLEVLTLLREPAHVTVPGYGEFDAPAGLNRHQFSEANGCPLHAGSVSAAASRNGRQVLRVTAPEQVTDHPFREDASMVCFSSNFDALWAEDFGSVPPLHYSEYGDADGDGLPNWFEMIWFGTFPDLQTALQTANPKAAPDADPDGDGFTNLQEFQNRTNPLKPETKPAVGEIWNFDAIHARGLSFNPDRDAHGTPVWYYFYRHGERLKTPHDGNYERCPMLSPDCFYAGKMAHLSPAQDPVYRYVHGWVSRKWDETARKWHVIIRPRVQAMLILGWKSPVSGTVSVRFRVCPLRGADPITLSVEHGTKSLWERVFRQGESENVNLPEIRVQKGDFIYLIGDEKPDYDASELELEDLEVELLRQD